ncbi:MAG: tRNA (adenosine(37)-N6)-dimethylallyltransferase MiaA [Oligoflexia bacterium]|nr:tRNA (adenosine(37)-N6)-dimethylallyltransferase MiaA [Oligoflexia bacterium]
MKKPKTHQYNYAKQKELSANTLILISGPTGSGKSNLAIELFEYLKKHQLNSEILSADSIAVYKGFDIGSSKPSKDDLKKVPHHLVNILRAEEEYTAADFSREASSIIQKNFANKSIPIITGGTGFYLKALLKGVVANETSEDTEEAKKIKTALEDIGKKEGFSLLYDKLKSLDPEATIKIHQNDHYRIVRALQAIEIYGEKWSVLNQKQREQEYRYKNFRLFCLLTEKETLLKRIQNRTTKMLSDGLIEEVQQLLNSGISKSLKPMMSVGYKEVVQYLDGQISLPECQDLIVRNTMHLAKQQMTWFRSDPTVEWLSEDHFERLIFALGFSS